MPSAVILAATSAPPPGGNGTTSLIGFVGFQASLCPGRRGADGEHADGEQF
jgi:hypothetical protein